MYFLSQGPLQSSANEKRPQIPAPGKSVLPNEWIEKILALALGGFRGIPRAPLQLLRECLKVLRQHLVIL
jgi:hypothetical protein